MSKDSFANPKSPEAIDSPFPQPLSRQGRGAFGRSQPCKTTAHLDRAAWLEFLDSLLATVRALLDTNIYIAKHHPPETKNRRH